MKKNNKKILISIFIFFIIILISVSIIMANDTNYNSNKIDKEKIYQEIKYFDFQLIYMTDVLNNIENKEEFYIDWKELEKQNKNLYNYWNSVILDLNNLDIEKKYLTDFGKRLDDLSVSIKNKNKQMCLVNILELYNRLIIYIENLNYNENTKNILQAKYNLLIAYAIVEKENWTLTHESIVESTNYISKVVTSMENNQYNQYNVNQAYIAVKELENLINVKDIDIFYLKYNIAMSKLENI